MVGQTTKMKFQTLPNHTSTFERNVLVKRNLVFKGERIIIPQKLRKIYIENVHASHIGIEGCLRRAREQLYWPRMNAELRDYISKCPICLKSRNNLQKEPIMQETVPERQWQMVSTDLFQLGRNEMK